MTPPFTPDEIVTYKTVNGFELTLAIFRPGKTPAPAVVCFHGGGWNKGTPTQFFPHVTHLASRGMIGLVATYRLRETHGATPRDCVADAKSAMRWVRSHASQLGILPEKIAAAGSSAGGHLAAATALLPGLNDADDDLSISPRPDALVLINPVFNNGPGQYGYERVVDYWQEISPFHHIRAGAPPTTVFLGREDSLISAETAEAYQSEMKAAGSRCDLHLYEGVSHGGFNFGEDQNPHFDSMLKLTDDFFTSLQFLPPIRQPN